MKLFSSTITVTEENLSLFKNPKIQLQRSESALKETEMRELADSKIIKMAPWLAETNNQHVVFKPTDSEYNKGFKINNYTAVRYKRDIWCVYVCVPPSRGVYIELIGPMLINYKLNADSIKRKGAILVKFEFAAAKNINWGVSVANEDGEKLCSTFHLKSCTSILDRKASDWV